MDRSNSPRPRPARFASMRRGSSTGRRYSRPRRTKDAISSGIRAESICASRCATSIPAASARPTWARNSASAAVSLRCLRTWVYHARSSPLHRASRTCVRCRERSPAIVVHSSLKVRCTPRSSFGCWRARSAASGNQGHGAMTEPHETRPRREAPGRRRWPVAIATSSAWKMTTRSAGPKPSRSSAGFMIRAIFSNGATRDRPADSACSPPNRPARPRQPLPSSRGFGLSGSAIGTVGEIEIVMTLRIVSVELPGAECNTQPLWKRHRRRSCCH